MNRLRSHLPFFLIIALYLLCIIIADPRGEFPLNDDWSYTRSAFAFGAGHGLKVDQWCAPSVVGQAIYGGLLTKIFAPSFLVLRLSTLLLSCSTACLIWGILLRSGFARSTASAMLFAWMFNPLQFSLSFTFMTEVPFLFFVALALYLFTVYLERGGALIISMAAASLGYAYLIRQTALLFLLAMICALLFDKRHEIPKRVLNAAAVAFISGAFIASYHIWSMLNNKGATAAVHRKFDLLNSITARQVVGNSYGMFFYIVLITAPVWMLLIPSIYRMSRDGNRMVRIGILLVLCTIAGSGVWWFHDQYRPGSYLPSAPYHSRMPFLLNVLYDSGVGPVTLDPDYYGAPPTPVYPMIWNGVTGMVAAGLIFTGAICVFGLMRLGSNPFFRKRRPVVLFSGISFLLLAAFEIIFSHLQEGGLFDRHVLIVALPFCLLIGFLAGEDAAGSDGRKTGAEFRIPALICAAIFAVFCVAATHDYMQWNRIRWDFGKGLLRDGIDPLLISGGFEFNGWHNYDTFVARGNIGNIHHWWYDRPEYIISMSQVEGYRVLRRRAFFSWVHRRPIDLYVEQRKL